MQAVRGGSPRLIRRNAAHPARRGVANMQRAAIPYHLTHNLTAQGQQVLLQKITAQARELHAELDRRAGADDRHGDPDYRHTRNDVLAAWAACEDRQRRPGAEHGGKSRFSLRCEGRTGRTIAGRSAAGAHRPPRWLRGVPCS